ncbi:MAG: hypothetical protein YSLV5_ORF09 [Yellowstone Lake virophage 5]|uniref:Uncharacterized protein n=1 Tax=Yellowstone Lake virophage 5 TaxID=1557033 RepID=A0A0A0RPA7_9VIRU|nr:MAG: hypothetical protein ASQ69_gp09 [Yellowstone Lake virophage 5]AIW01867.1 MAG: hypothetical protein YSLV5_ORF09 [Yellowstone Lake virophage 5]
MWGERQKLTTPSAKWFGVSKMSDNEFAFDNICLALISENAFSHWWDSNTEIILADGIAHLSGDVINTMNDAHPFPKGTKIDASCRCQKVRHRLSGSSWLDIWMTIDYIRKQCDHTFIESIEHKGDTIVVHLGS